VGRLRPKLINRFVHETIKKFQFLFVVRKKFFVIRSSPCSSRVVLPRKVALFDFLSDFETLRPRSFELCTVQASFD